MDWQPIETAPKGVEVILYDEEYCPEYGVEGMLFVDVWKSSYGSKINPSHWMPLPEPPK